MDRESLEVVQRLESLVVTPIGISQLHVLDSHVDGPIPGSSSISKWLLDSGVLCMLSTIAVSLLKEPEVMVVARKMHNGREVKEFVKNGIPALEL